MASAIHPKMSFPLSRDDIGRGFTLLEVLVAVFILVIFLVVVFNIFPVTRHALQLSENHLNAAFLGQSLLEEARTAGFSSIVPISGSRTFSGTDNGNPFTQTINYSVSLQSLDIDKKRVWAMLLWREFTGSKQIVLETTIVDPNITAPSLGRRGLTCSLISLHQDAGYFARCVISLLP